MTPGEDGAENSAAGQMESVLGVKGLQGVSWPILKLTY